MRLWRVLRRVYPICTHTISVQSAKPSHAYPIIRLPRAFRRLVGAAATIYETMHNGALASLVVPHGNRKRDCSSDLDGKNPYRSLCTAKVGPPLLAASLLSSPDHGDAYDGP